MCCVLYCYMAVWCDMQLMPSFLLQQMQRVLMYPELTRRCCAAHVTGSAAAAAGIWSCRLQLQTEQHIVHMLLATAHNVCFALLWCFGCVFGMVEVWLQQLTYSQCCLCFAVLVVGRHVGA